MKEQDVQDIQAMLFAIYKKLLEIEDRQKGNGGTHPTWSVVKDLQKEADKIRNELKNSG